MCRRRPILGLLPLLLVARARAFAAATPAIELRLVTHASFDLPKPLLARFEAQHQVKLVVIKAGDAGEMVNKLILTRAHPIADVLYGIDNTSVSKALRAGVIAPYASADQARRPAAELAPGVVAINRGYVTLNADLAWFKARGLALPTSLRDLTQPAYRKLLVVPNPATSSPGFAFMASTIAALGEPAAWAWWAALRANGLKVSPGWTQAYYTEFSRNKGPRPLVVSYASSPAAEVFYSKTPLTQAPTRSLNLPGAVFSQVEGAALVRGGQHPELAGRFIEFLRSREVQSALQTTMWMLPAEPGVPRAEVLTRHAPDPVHADTPSIDDMGTHSAAWIRQWTRVVLK
jgi:thiamine transport system substrate-binding protein